MEETIGAALLNVSGVAPDAIAVPSHRKLRLINTSLGRALAIRPISPAPSDTQFRLEESVSVPPAVIAPSVPVGEFRVPARFVTVAPELITTLPVPVMAFDTSTFDPSVKTA